MGNLTTRESDEAELSAINAELAKRDHEHNERRYRALKGKSLAAHVDEQLRRDLLASY